MTVALSTLGKKTCARYHADPPTITLAQVNQLLALGRITQEDYDCVIDPECDCEFSSPTAAAAEVT